MTREYVRFPVDQLSEIFSNNGNLLILAFFMIFGVTIYFIDNWNSEQKGR